MICCSGSGRFMLVPLALNPSLVRRGTKQVYRCALKCRHHAELHLYHLRDAVRRERPVATSSTSRAVHEETAHGFGGSSKEMAAAVPVLSLLHVHEPHIGFMHQRCGVQGLAGLLAG